MTSSGRGQRYYMQRCLVCNIPRWEHYSHRDCRGFVPSRYLHTYVGVLRDLVYGSAGRLVRWLRLIRNIYTEGNKQ